MNTNVAKLAPKNVWENFQAICAIPHPSKHEDKIRKCMVDFCKKNDLDVKVDKIGNVLVSKPATKGMENRKGVVLQAHLDMVPQKNSDKKHDFTKDPISAYIDGEWVTANGTTLGADNGMGVAAAMAILTSKNIPHGPIEALFTTDEETGMTGAFGLQKGVLKGDILLNLDSETEGELYVGCAGGIDAFITLNYKTQPRANDVVAYDLAIKGLKGGHSGMDIILGRGNANKLLFRLLKILVKKCGVEIASINGGSLRNAIPREAFALITVPIANSDLLEKHIKTFFQTTKDELAGVEPDYEVSATFGKLPKEVMTKTAATKLINLVYGIPNGVIRMSDAMPGLVETSSNMAIVKAEKGSAEISCLLRSSVDSAKTDLVEAMDSVVRLAGAKAKFTGGYPGWKPNPSSPILKTMQSVYKNLYKKTPKIMAIHAGLECGLLGGAYPNWDMISFGPTICFPHSPDEKVNIESVQKFWDFLVAVLAEIPKK